MNWSDHDLESDKNFFYCLIFATALALAAKYNLFAVRLSMIYVTLYGMITAHELAHWITAQVLRIPTNCVSIGLGPDVARWTVRGERFEFLLWPLSGHVAPAWPPKHRWKFAAISAAGPFSDICFLTTSLIFGLPAYIQSLLIAVIVVGSLNPFDKSSDLRRALDNLGE